MNKMCHLRLFQISEVSSFTLVKKYRQSNFSLFKFLLLNRHHRSEKFMCYQYLQESNFFVYGYIFVHVVATILLHKYFTLYLYLPTYFTLYILFYSIFILPTYTYNTHFTLHIHTTPILPYIYTQHLFYPTYTYNTRFTLHIHTTPILPYIYIQHPFYPTYTHNTHLPYIHYVLPLFYRQGFLGNNYWTFFKFIIELLRCNCFKSLTCLYF
jgi:hypothetical protein